MLNKLEAAASTARPPQRSFLSPSFLRLHPALLGAVRSQLAGSGKWRPNRDLEAGDRTLTERCGEDCHHKRKGAPSKL